MKALIEQNKILLMEAAIVERLRRSASIDLHDTLLNAPLIYDPVTRSAMTTLYHQYMRIALQAGMPMLVCTPTWRAAKDRVEQSGVNPCINKDAVAYMKDIRLDPKIKIGGMIGCKNDCYQPDQGLSVTEADQYHSWQIGELVSGGVDFLIAETLPNVDEALGIAKAMEHTATPYIISFVITRNGRVMDGTSLQDAVDYIDSSTINRPLGYMVNCAYPSFLQPQQHPRELFTRLIGFQANASSLDHCDLDNADELKTDSISEWGAMMLELNVTYGVKILGGCCGTDHAHLNYLVDKHLE